MDDGRQSKGGGHESAARPAPHVSADRSALDAVLQEIDRLVRVSELHQAADNVVAALECLDRAEALANEVPTKPQLAAELKYRVSDCLRKRGDLSGALDRILESRDILTDRCDPVLRGKILSREGATHAGLGDYDRAFECCHEAYELLRQSDEHVEVGMLQLTLGTIHVRAGRMRESQECFESALFTFRRINHREGIARALNNLGLLLKNGPRWADARDYLKRALAVSEDAGNYARIATHCANLGILHTKLCEWELAEQHLSRSVSIHKEVGNSFSLAKALLAHAMLHRRRGQRELAASCIAAARELCQEHAYGRELVLCWEGEGDLLIDGGRLREAAESLRHGLELAVHVAPDGDLVPELQRRLAAIALRQGDLAEARRLAARAARGARNVRDNAEAGAARRILGEALSLQGMNRAAEQALTKAVEMLGQTPERLEQALAQMALSRHLAKTGAALGTKGAPDRQRLAIELLQKAWGFFVSVSLPDRAAEALTDLAEARLTFSDLEGALRDIARAHALAEKVGRADLMVRLERTRAALESRSAETALLSVPEVAIIQEWTRLSNEGGSVGSWIQKMLVFVVDRLESSSAVLAAPLGSRRKKIVGRIGLEADQARALLRIVSPHLGGTGITLGADPHNDPRFAGHVAGELGAVRSFAALKIALPVGFAVLYLDRREPHDRPYGRSDLRLLSVLSGLLGLGLIQVRRERALARQGAADRSEHADGPFARYITADPGLLQTFRHLERVGHSSASILILGETGTGKGLLAECIHRASARRDGPFVSINCAAIPESLLESELFGHVQGSFTGAYKDKRGLFEEAHGGTLFLDEISRTSLAVQAKLLHALDNREIRPVGAVRGRDVDVRVICASNVEMQAAIRAGEFLEDLFYRLCDFSLTLPPLRKRRGDIPLLLDHFFELACRDMDRHPKGFDREVKARLLDHDWRGNIRELIQVIRRLVALCEDGELAAVDLLPAEFRNGASGTGLPEDGPQVVHSVGPLSGGGDGSNLRSQVLDLERRLIREALDRHDWNRSAAARDLGISYPSLLSKIRLFDLNPPVK
jgi:DNA-binding NtrC family response regulator/tetratricopeptide (TPR) repeat protein